MTSEPQEASFVQLTEHPYIVRVAGICGGRPTIKASRVAVSQTAEEMHNRIVFLQQFT